MNCKSLFPDLLTSPFAHSILQRAQKKGVAEIVVHNLRDYATNKQKSVDDYPYGFYMIKTIQVESTLGNSNRVSGINKITYIANHKFGMVGVKVDFEDGTSSTFPVYTSAEN